MKTAATSVVKRAALVAMAQVFIACGADYGVGPTSVMNNMITLQPNAIAYRRDGTVSAGAVLWMTEAGGALGGGPRCSISLAPDANGLHHCPDSVTLQMKTDYTILLQESGRTSNSDSPDQFLVGTQRVTRAGSFCVFFNICGTGGFFRIVNDRGKIE